jgi:threonine dehydratase
MLDFEDVLDARERVEDVARHTPLDYSHTFSDMTGAEVHLKLENHQRTGSFKIRGATNCIRTLTDTERDRGVVTASAGNHAQGVALAASRSGVDARVVMPEHAPIAKVSATRDYGAEVVLHGADYNEAQERAQEIAEAENRTYVHAFDDWAVMAGQGTLGLEIVEELPDLDTVIVPIGGGGLISGVATGVLGRNPDARIVGVQADGASSVAPSLQKGEIVALDSVDTIADGIATRHVGEKPFEVIQQRVDEVVTVSDEDIADAVLLLLERAKTLVEGAGAVPLAALLQGAIEYEEDEVIVPALCGGNIDVNLLTRVLVNGLIQRGRYLRIRTVLADTPGSLEEFIEIISEHQANIYAVEHDRSQRDVAMTATEVELDLQTRGPDHVATLLDALEDAGYEVEVLC